MVVSYAAAVAISIGVLVNGIVDEWGLSVLASGPRCHVEPHLANLESTHPRSSRGDGALAKYLGESGIFT